VGLVHAQKAGIKYEKPLWFLVSVGFPDRRGGRSISSDRSSADRPHCHSGIFFSCANILGSLGASYQRGRSELPVTRVA